MHEQNVDNAYIGNSFYSPTEAKHERSSFVSHWSPLPWTQYNGAVITPNDNEENF